MSTFADQFDAALIPMVYEGSKTEKDLALFIDGGVAFRKLPRTNQTDVNDLLVIDFSDGSFFVLIPGHRVVGQGTWDEVAE